MSFLRLLRNRWFLGGIIVATLWIGLMPNLAYADTQPNYCDTNNATFKQELYTQPIFPLIPKFLIDYSLNHDNGGCNPSDWNINVIGSLVYKALALLNYIAGAAAILATIYGGVLYLSGFASKKAAETAKKVIAGAYIGLIIVLMARVIVQGSFYFFGDGTLNVTTIISPESSNP